MIGDFQYVSSSEDSNSEYESDSGDSDGGVNKLYEERTELDKKIKAYEEKLETIQKILKTLNNERKTLLEKRNQLIASVSADEDVASGEPLATSIPIESAANCSSSNVRNPFDMVSNSEPLNLNVTPMMKCDNDEEFDSEDDLWYELL